MLIYKKVFVDRMKTRWVNLDEFGTKDTITLKTFSGRLITRTCQYWYQDSYNGEIINFCKISYKGRYWHVSINTILED